MGWFSTKPHPSRPASVQAPVDKGARASPRPTVPPTSTTLHSPFPFPIPHYILCVPPMRAGFLRFSTKPRSPRPASVQASPTPLSHPPSPTNTHRHLTLQPQKISPHQTNQTAPAATAGSEGGLPERARASTHPAPPPTSTPLRFPFPLPIPPFALRLPPMRAGFLRFSTKPRSRPASVQAPPTPLSHPLLPNNTHHCSSLQPQETPPHQTR